MRMEYTKAEHLTSFIEYRHTQGKTYREIAAGKELSRSVIWNVFH